MLRLLKRTQITAAIIAISAAAGIYWYMLGVPGRTHHGAMPELTAEERTLAQSLEAHVKAIASEPHNTWYPKALAASSQYIKTHLEGLGLKVVPQPYESAGVTVENIEVSIAQPPGDEQKPLLIVGAHYESAYFAPGANDNATGTAAILELARLLKGIPANDVELRLVLFVNEEPPHFKTSSMGSKVYVEKLKAAGADVRGMISLECLGAFADEPGSQRYPSPFEKVFPTTGNFVSFVGPMNARPLRHEVMASFRKHTSFPSIGGVAPRYIPGIDWSDHASFDDEGRPAMMIPDTAVYRYPHYHKETDTPDKIDYEKLARLTTGIERVIRDLAR